MRRIALTTVVLACAALLAAPAQAAAPPTYTCDLLGGDPATTRISGNCTASPGAVTNGGFRGESILASRVQPLRIRCTQGGHASVPTAVVGYDCTLLPLATGR
ncbi:hypothetical protein [Streptosporangium sp. KLBMP 9127]|nr:hypothetical protein [Streptosporangium sp. KLBMP 9127]